MHACTACVGSRGEREASVEPGALLSELHRLAHPPSLLLTLEGSLSLPDEALQLGLGTGDVVRCLVAHAGRVEAATERVGQAVGLDHDVVREVEEVGRGVVDLAQQLELLLSDGVLGGVGHERQHRGRGNPPQAESRGPPERVRAGLGASGPLSSYVCMVVIMECVWIVRFGHALRQREWVSANE